METIKEGDLIPDCHVFEEYPTNKVRIRDFTDEKRVILIGFIGAFVPVCSRVFIPEYVEKADELKAKHNVTECLAVVVQDAFVVNAFNKCLNKDNKFRMFADQDASFVRAMGLSWDAGVLASVRSRRFSMLIENNVVLEINVEPDSLSITCTAPDKLGKKMEDRLAAQNKGPAIVPEFPDAPATPRGSFIPREKASIKNMRSPSIKSRPSKKIGRPSRTVYLEEGGEEY